jgi:hypothetical protein
MFSFSFLNKQTSLLDFTFTIISYCRSPFRAVNNTTIKSDTNGQHGIPDHIRVFFPCVIVNDTSLIRTVWIQTSRCNKKINIFYVFFHLKKDGFHTYTQSTLVVDINYRRYRSRRTHGRTEILNFIYVGIYIRIRINYVFYYTCI